MMRKQQPGRNDGDKTHQPQHDAAADREFLRDDIKDVVERADRRQLSAPAYPRQLHQGSDHARSHQKQDFGGTHRIHWCAVGVRYFFISQGNDPPHQNRHRR